MVLVVVESCELVDWSKQDEAAQSEGLGDDWLRWLVLAFRRQANKWYCVRRRDLTELVAYLAANAVDRQSGARAARRPCQLGRAQAEAADRLGGLLVVKLVVRLGNRQDASDGQRVRVALFAQTALAGWRVERLNRCHEPALEFGQHRRAWRHLGLALEPRRSPILRTA